MSVSENRLQVVFGSGQVGRALCRSPGRVGSARAGGIAPPAGRPSRGRRLAWGRRDRSRGRFRRGRGRQPSSTNASTRLTRNGRSSSRRSSEECWPRLNETDALLVSLENLYGYGPTHGAPMTEDLPLAATTVKGRTRAAMTPGVARRPRRRACPYRHRAGLGLLRCRRDRVNAGRADLCQRPGGASGRLHRQP